MKLRRFLMNFLYNIALILTCFSNVAFAAVTLDPSVIAILTEVTQVLLVIAGGACVGKLIHIGILYVSATAADKSNAKTALLPWLIGTFVCFGAAIIGPAIINIFKVTGEGGGMKPVLSY